MVANLYRIPKPQTVNEKKTKTALEVMLVTPELLGKWRSPPFQRPVRQNEKVRALAEQMKLEDGIWPGIITLGVLNGETYIIDGQHRKESFLLSGLKEGLINACIHYFQSMAEMGEEFVKLNSQLARMRPDDILRGLEDSIPGLKRIRMTCPFVGYDFIRRNTATAPMVGMSVTIRAWCGSTTEVPSPNHGGMSAAGMAETMDDSEYDSLIQFLTMANTAFGRDPQYGRLWSGLNLIICMWMYRRLVLNPPSSPNSRSQQLTKDMFKKCLMSVSASSDYVDWLLGRNIGERDRAPAYARLKSIFAKRLAQEVGHKVSLPQPAWSSR
jgi:hypothetical protein